MFGLIFYICLCIFVSFFCSLLEACLLSLPQSYINSMANTGDKGALRLAKLKENINKPLAAILSLNTIANTVGAAGVGAKVLALYGNKYVALSSGLLTLGILIFSEIIPKTIGAMFSKPLSKMASVVLPVMIFFTYPFVIISERLGNFIAGRADDDDQRFTRDEMIATTEIGESDGAIKENESIIIRNLLNLNELNVQDVMTPISEVSLYQQDTTVQQIMDGSPLLRYSRFPVYGENLNDITGMVLRYQIMKAVGDDNFDVSLEKLVNPIRVVSKNLSVASALKQFIKYKEHMFMVMNEYGATAGIITLEDSIEALLGEDIIDELDYDTDTEFHLEHDLLTNKYIIKKATNEEE